ncbi:CbtA family protein [Mycobacterium sp. shizuoka-1]|uniref:CbtA family protein n=1 Tax=Mycobacterium sp. shizuoka-1 TaxID=2039281 RepID=UPI000C0641FA|nr:CbtA family protein [Mycobacterium sp. shizuoka-1]GAY19196.1 cobalt transporter [Mycobacterium sp. shizuoka-1]
MEKSIIWRGILAGALGGVLAFVFAKIFTEPVIDRAIGFEDEMAHSHGEHEHGVELFTRGVQGNIGMGFGVFAFAVAMGALLAVVFAVVYGRVGETAPRQLAMRVAGSMLLCLYVVPALKYPPNPPAASLEETIRQRTLLYVLMVVLSAALFVAAVLVRRRLAQRLDGWNATLIAAGGYVVAIAVVMVALPAIDETPEHFPADLLYEFRLYSLGTQVVMWATIGAVFAALMHRLLGSPDRETIAA